MPNTSLSNLVSDGDLASNAAEASETFAAGSNSSNTIASDFIPLLVHYTAASQSYSLTVSGRGQTFFPADVVSAKSWPGMVYYDKSTAGIADTFTRIRPGTATSVPIYYVGIGGWARTQDQTGGTGPSSWGDAFVYGFPTATAAVPTSGLRRYTVDAMAIEPTGPVLSADRLQRRIGEGEILVDFAAHTVRVTYVRHDIADTESKDLPSAPPVATFTGAGTLAADGTFTGTFDCSGCANPTQFRGAVYGPAAEEIGLSYARGVVPFLTGAGSLIGQQRGLFDADVIDTGYSSAETSLSAGASWQILQFRYAIQNNASLFYPNRYSTITARYYLYTNLGAGPPPVGNNPFGFRENGFSFAQTIPAETTPQYNVYGYAAPASSIAPAADQRLYLLNPLSVDPGLVLHFVKLGRFERREISGRHSDIFFASGTPTPTTAVPASGTGHYVGVIAGLYLPVEGEGSGAASYYYLVGGTVDLNVDFATRTVTGTFHPTARKSTDNSNTDMGVFAIANGTIDANGAISAQILANPNAAYPTTNGQFSARLYGPTAGELGLRFSLLTCHLCIDPPPSYDAFNAAGVASKR